MHYQICGRIRVLLMFDTRKKIATKSIGKGKVVDHSGLAV
jgi:hypothetical protein